MNHMKLRGSSSTVWMVSITNATSGKPAGKFRMDASCGTPTIRFIQGLTKAVDTDLVFLTARRKREDFPLKMPLPTAMKAEDSGLASALEYMQSMYNNFLDNDWEPVFEGFGGDRWLVDISEVRNAHKPQQEETRTIAAPYGTEGVRPAFRTKF